MTQNSTEDERLTAFHEAGHAIAYFEAGFDFEFVTVRRAEDALGWVAVVEREIDDFDRAVIAAAGVHAQAMADWLNSDQEEYVFADCWLAAVLDGGREDIESFAHFPGWRQAQVNVQAELLVEEHWEDIATVETTLLRDGTLTFEEFRSLLSATTLGS